MRLSAYMILMFSICVVAYFMGYPPLLLQLYDSQGGYLDIGVFLKSLFDSITTTAGLSALGISIGAAAILTFLSGFGAIYIIPLFIITAVLNLFIFPISFLLNQDIDFSARLILQVFFNIVTMLAILDFTRGGS